MLKAEAINQLEAVILPSFFPYSPHVKTLRWPEEAMLHQWIEKSMLTLEEIFFPKIKSEQSRKH